VLAERKVEDYTAIHGIRARHCRRRMGAWSCNLIALNFDSRLWRVISITLGRSYLHETALRNYGIVGWMGRGADVEKLEHRKYLPLAGSKPESAVLQSWSVKCLHIPAAEDWSKWPQTDSTHISYFIATRHVFQPCLLLLSILNYISSSEWLWYLKSRHYTLPQKQTIKDFYSIFTSLGNNYAY
jgi:hypothetical protein